MKGSGSCDGDACPKDGLPCTFKRELDCLTVNVVSMSLDELMQRGWSYVNTLAQLRLLNDIGSGEPRDQEVVEGVKILMEVVNRELARRGHSVSFF